MRFLCSTLYKDDDNAAEEWMNKSGKRGEGKTVRTETFSRVAVAGGEH